MAIIDDKTGGRSWALPNAANKLKDDVVRLRSALAAADGDVTALLLALAGKADAGHGHVISDVSGLQTALDGKIAVGYHDNLDDLSDVSVTGAANGQVLIRQGAAWIPVALQVGNITGLEGLLNGKADGTATADALALKAPLASPPLTGTPTAPTATAGTDNTQVATTGFVQGAIAALKGGVAGAYDTLAKLATAILGRALKIDTRRNRIVNGSMAVSQENGNTLGTINGYYPADQFALYFTAASAAMSVQRVQARTLANALDQIEFKTTTAKASLAAGDSVTITQNIEGSAFSDAGFGTANAKPLVLRAQVQLPAGLYHFHFQNSAGNRHCAVPFTIAGGEANTAVVKEIVVPADTSGTWLTGDGVIGITVDLVLAVGATKTGGSASTWGGTAYLAASTQFNILSSTSNAARLADVGLKLDPDATGTYGAYRVNEVDAVYRSERYGQLVETGTGVCYTATVAVVNTPFLLALCKTPPTAVLKTVGSLVVGGSSATVSSISLTGASSAKAGCCNITVGGGLTVGAGTAWQSGSILYLSRL